MSGYGDPLYDRGAEIPFVEIARVDPVLATVAGFIGALVVSFFANRGWVFASRAGTGPALARYTIVCGVGFALNLGLMALVTRALAADYGIATIDAIALGRVNSWPSRLSRPPAPIGRK